MGRRGAKAESREQKGRIESERLVPTERRPSIGGQEGADRAAGCENIDGLERTGNRGTDTTETKRKRRHLAGSGEVPRLRSAVAVVETAVALVGPGCKRRRRCKTPSCSCAARRCSISPHIHPARRCFLFSPAALRCFCRRQRQLTYSPPRRTRLHPGSWGDGFAARPT